MISSRYLKIVPDRLFLKLKYFYFFKRRLNFKTPQTFNEKINWLKLYDRNPKYTNLVDKYEVKKYVASKIGNKYVISTLDVYERFDDIDFNKLPKQFVIKCTHDSGGLVICKDKKKLDTEKARQKIEKSLKNNYYYHAREWPYKNVKPRIIVEEYKEDKKDGELRDYKFFCFNGEPKFMFVATNRFGEGDTYFDFFDMDYKHMPFTQGHPNAPVMPKKPKNFEKMQKLAKRLSEDIPFVRVDFYDVNGEIFFGELTFSHFSGMMPIVPDEWDYKLGDLIALEEIK